VVLGSAGRAVESATRGVRGWWREGGHHVLQHLHFTRRIGHIRVRSTHGRPYDRHLRDASRHRAEWDATEASVPPYGHALICHLPALRCAARRGSVGDNGLCGISCRGLARAGVTDLRADGSRAFDFIYGLWTVHNRKLRNVTDPTCEEWVEFDATSEAFPVLNGTGHVDWIYVPDPPDGDAFEGFTLRLYDPSSATWSIWWSSYRVTGCRHWAPWRRRIPRSRDTSQRT
jgi:hypothetical protein